MENRPVAAFDFDGTLIDHDTLLPLLYHLKGGRKVSLALFRLIPLIFLYLIGQSGRQELKEALLAYMMGGDSFEQVRQQSETFVDEKVLIDLVPSMVERLKWHQAEGHLCLLISANIDVLADPVGRALHFDHVISSKLEVVGGRITGRLIGKNCRGQEKVERLTKLLGPLDKITLYAYGDSAGDKELLAAATYPTRV